MNNARILIVEDDVNVAIYLKAALISMGYQVTGLAASGETAISAARLDRPDAILMDVRLGNKMTGIQAAEEIHKTAAIPILYITAYTDEDSLQQAKSSDTYAYLFKPLRYHELHASLEMALYKHATEQRIQHLNQVLRAISEVNLLLTREHDPLKLLKGVCKILVRTRGYRFVWIGQLEGKRSRAVATAGKSKTFLDLIAATASQRQAQTLPCATSMRTKKPVICSNLLEDERYKPWKKEAENAGFYSSSAIPMLYGKRQFGTLCVFSDQKDGFSDKEELTLLLQVAGEIALRLKTIEEEAERKHAEEKLRESEQRFHALIEKAADLILVISSVGVIQFASPTVEKISGYLPQEVVGRNLLEWVHPDDLPGVQRSLASRSQIPGTASGSLIVRTHHKNGEWRILEALGTNLLDEPAIQGIVLNVRDVTEQKQVEKVIRESESRYRSLFEYTPIALMEEDFSGAKQILEALKQEGITDFETYLVLHPEVVAECAARIKVTGANKAALRLFGAKKKEYLLTDLKRLLGKESINYFILELAYIAKGHKKFEWEGINRTLAGDLIYINLNWLAAPGHEESLSKVIIAIMDVTERKRTIDALRESEERYRQLFDLSPDAIVIHNDKTFQLANEAAAKLLGAVSPQELVGKPILSVVHPEYLVTVQGRVKLLLEGKSLPATTEKFIRLDGIAIDVRVTSIPYSDREPHGILAILHDITEQKKAEDALRRQNAYLAALQETMLELISLHDLKALLENIVRRAGQLLGTEAGFLDLVEPGSQQLRPQVGLGALTESLKHASQPGKGVAGTVWQTAKPLVIDDYDSWEGRIKKFSLNTIQSIIGVPLLSGEQVVGVLGLAYAYPSTQTFGAEAIELITQFARLATLAIENARVFTALQQELAERKAAEAEINRHLSELEVLYENGLAISQLLEPKQIGQKLIETLSKKLAWHHAAIRAIQPETGELVLLAYGHPGLNKTELEDEITRLNQLVSDSGKGLSGWVTKHGKPIRCAQVKKNKHYLETYPGIQSGLYVPIQAGGHTIGSIAVESEQEGAFSEQDQRLLTTIASQAAISIQNAQLFSTGQQELAARKQAEQALLEAHAELERRVAERTAEVQDLYNNAPCGYHSLDAKGEFVHINKTEADWLGYKSEDIIGHPVKDFLSESSQALFRELFPRFKKNGVLKDQEMEFVRKDGSILPLLINATAIYDENGTYKMSRSTALDITRRKLIEAALRESESHLRQNRDELSAANIALEKAARMKDEFLASMSHELRTPLTGILGLAEALQLSTYGELSEKQLRALKNIENSGRHLLELINDILDLSKIEAGKFEVQMEQCSLIDICRASLQLAKGIAQQKYQEVNFSMRPNSIYLRTDARRLKQMLVNLLSNAVKFTPDGGSIGLEVQASESEHLVRLTVWDTGIGIKAEELKKLFKPFVQLDSSLSRQYSGTGLGLSLVQRMAELQGGRVEVESLPAKGSRFTIVLPWIVQNEESDNTPPKKTASFTTVQPAPAKEFEHKEPPALILIADDSEDILEILSDFLKTEHFRVITTRSGRELLEHAPELHPDIFLIDIQMPGMDGLETIRRIRAHLDSKVAATPIIAITALAMPGDRERCLAAGANEYLSKPLQLVKLSTVIQEILY
jgi:PAS domain S-box-containing protein